MSTAYLPRGCTYGMQLEVSDQGYRFRYGHHCQWGDKGSCRAYVEED